jgi:histidinol-phosphate/aromatic aminotransferase/cobyric acid decarboxylase-like protein
MANFEPLLTQYPSGMSVNTLLAGKYFSINQKYLVVGNGASELIKSLLSFIEGKMGVVFPTFEEYPNRKSKDEIVPYYPSNENFFYTADDLIKFFTGKGISILLLINPDNPSGNFIPLSGIQKLIDWAEMNEIKLVVDESFVDFSFDSCKNSLLNNRMLDSHPHLVVVKSISKSYGVPGLRLGVIASSDKELIGYIRKDVAIWNINSFAEFYMQIFHKYENDYKVACQQFIEEREWFYQRLNKISYLRIIPSQANYFLCEVKPPFTAKSLAHKLLVNSDILIKDCSTKEGFNGREFVRIAIKNRYENETIIQKIKSYERNSQVNGTLS